MKNKQKPGATSRCTYASKKIIPEIVFGKRHDPGQITCLTQKTEDSIIVEEKN